MRQDAFPAGPAPIAAADGAELLVGSQAFWARAASDIAAARRRVLVQAMTCEGDAAGQAVVAAIAASDAPQRCLLVDAYSLYVTNDRMLPALPWRPSALRAEQAATRAMLAEAAAAGIDVALSNPVGVNPLRFPLRNHKKLIVADDVAYLGGINLSDHNFAWHDAMVRFADPALADLLAASFAADRAGQSRCSAGRFGALEVIALDGVSNTAALSPVIELFARARSVELVGAYPTLPFTDALNRAASAGGDVTIYTPVANNKPLLRDYLFAAAKGGLKLALLPEMTHAKAALVNRDTVLFGSVNFNLASWRSNGDFLAISRDPGLVAAFEAQLFAPARAIARPAVAGEVSGWRKLRARVLLALGDAALAPVARAFRPRLPRVIRRP